MADLFAAVENARAGWRLDRLEILNWGTFDGPIWRLSPHSLTSLLTGDNGSGKSTAVDAILTLLVPPGKRSYNLASGSDKRKERDESSYVLGAYGQERDEATNRSRVKTHRERATARSVLLAVFKNDALSAAATLAQVFWFEGETPKKFHFVTEQELSIQDHFLASGSPAELKKRLRGLGHVTDSFRDYQGRFEKIFGLRSEKALALFNQTVSLKSIGSLTAFVREHMLEAGDATEALERLRESHEDLSRSHEAILVARRQQEILDPLAGHAKEMATADEARAEDVKIETAIPSWVAGIRKSLAGQSIDEIRRTRSELEAKLKPLERDLEDARSEMATVERDIASDASGQRIQELEREERRLQGVLSQIQARQARLGEVLAPLNFPMPESDADRIDLLESSRDVLRQLDLDRVDCNGKRDELVKDLGACEKALFDLRTELDSLRQRQTQIPEMHIHIRRELCLAIGADEADLPYAGELMRVRENESAWEPAIERLLHGFALRMLVPPRLYRDVRDHVDATHLRGRLVFHRAEKPRNEPAPPDPETVAGKIELRPGSPLKAWLAAHLAARFDHACCETLDDIPAGRFALTRNGLVRGGEGSHEKDDRHRLDDRSRWVLGWTNEEKIKALAEQLALRNEDGNRLRHRQGEIDAALAIIRRDESLHERLPELLISWEALDLDGTKNRLADLSQEREQLASSSDILSTLRLRRENLRQKLDELDRRRTELLKEDGALESRIKSLESDLARCDKVLAESGPCGESERTRLEAELARRKTIPDHANIEELGRKLTEWSRKRQQDRSAEIARLRDAIQGAMGEYLKRFPADSADLGARLDFLESFLALHRRVVHDDLPRHEERFRELLRTRVVQGVNTFRTGLDREERAIRVAIDSLNASLARIPYTPRTHLQLIAGVVHDEEIRAFKADLRDCIGDLSREDEAENEARFLRIQKILKRLQDEERWRKKVIDVRNWLEFSASERYTETGEEARHYPDSAGLSGGQKAKLAYTVLASGLAWHFGLEDGEVANRSLRFVVIDEAFSRSDDDSSRFCLELFGKLDLQLLVVTPSDKIHVVEPYIATCHYVWYDRDTDRSQVCDLSLSELHDRRAKARRAQRGEA